LQGIPTIVQKLIEELSQFPGIGKKSAQRMAYFLMKTNRENVVRLAKSMIEVKDTIAECSVCQMQTDIQPCAICQDRKRENHILCIVEESTDVYAIERANVFFGKYHVLGGFLSPLDGIGPDDLHINSLLARLSEFSEVLIATNPSPEGDATAMYISKLVENKNIAISRLARGIPAGGHMEYLDEETLRRAITGRTCE